MPLCLGSATRRYDRSIFGALHAALERQTRFSRWTTGRRRFDAWRERRAQTQRENGEKRRSRRRVRANGSYTRMIKRSSGENEPRVIPA